MAAEMYRKESPKVLAEVDAKLAEMTARLERAREDTAPGTLGTERTPAQYQSYVFSLSNGRLCLRFSF